MKRMTTLKDHERRITALEGRLQEVEASHGESIYKLRRGDIENRIGMRMLLHQAGLPPVTPEQIDELLDQE